MLAAGRNLYGNPDHCIQILNNSMPHYTFDTLTTTFNLYGLIPRSLLRI